MCIYLCGYQIAHSVLTLHGLFHYHDTTNDSGYLSQLELFQSRDRLILTKILRNFWLSRVKLAQWPEAIEDTDDISTEEWDPHLNESWIAITLRFTLTQSSSCPVGWGCRIHRLLLCRGVRPPPPTSVLDMTLNNLMVRFEQCWRFGECGVPLHCHRSQVHSDLEW